MHPQCTTPVWARLKWDLSARRCHICAGTGLTTAMPAGGVAPIAATCARSACGKSPDRNAPRLPCARVCGRARGSGPGCPMAVDVRVRVPRREGLYGGWGVRGSGPHCTLCRAWRIGCGIFLFFSFRGYFVCVLCCVGTCRAASLHLADKIWEARCVDRPGLRRGAAAATQLRLSAHGRDTAEDPRALCVLHAHMPSA